MIHHLMPPEPMLRKVRRRWSPRPLALADADEISRTYSNEKGRRGRKSFAVVPLVALALLAIWGHIGRPPVSSPPPTAGDARARPLAAVSGIPSALDDRGKATAEHGGGTDSGGSGEGVVAHGSGMGDGDVAVFIGIKVGAGTRGVRFSQIRRTWLEDALVWAGRGRVDIKFFTGEGDVAAAAASSESALDGRFLGERGSAGVGVSLRSLLVSSQCATDDLLCRTSAVFAHYAEHYVNGTGAIGTEAVSPYFCSFDDDQYVIVRNLLHVLGVYDRSPPWHGRNVFIGKKPAGMRGIMGITYPGVQGVFHFVQGGAGYCLSRDVVERGQRYLTALEASLNTSLGNNDDYAVGYVVDRMLGIEPVQDELFHSHLEIGLRTTLPKDDIAKQVSFGFNTKKREEDRFPNIPMRFSSEEDPMQFRSLRCFLIKEETGREPFECMEQETRTQTRI